MTALFCLAFASCQSDVIPVDEPAGNGTLTVTGTVTVPRMHVAETRGDFANTPGADLQLTIMEFYAADKDAPASQWWLKNVYKAETKSVTNVENGQTVTFTVTFNSTDAPTHLHLMVADDYVTNVEFGSEATVLPYVTVSGNKEAYWGMVNFKDGLTETVITEGENHEIISETKLRAEVTEKLQNVPVIRNFAAITVTDAEDPDSETGDNFDLYDFEIVHVPSEGSIAPINPDINNPYIPELLEDGAMKSYSAISQTYAGYTPISASFGNKETDGSIINWEPNKTAAPNSVGPLYLYEHPFESTRRTYLLIYGYYKPTGTYGYYKVDIGKVQSDGNFEYYNIIRNINYNVKINAVRAAGAATPSAAISRAPFNNISASVETSSMLSVSNGTNLLAVNATSHIIVTEDQKIDILYRYVKNVTTDKTPANDVPRFICQENGPVVKSYEQVADSVDKNKVKWVRYTITPQTPTDEVKTQNITIVDPDGLGRVIRLTLRKPWQYAPLYAGASEYMTVDDDVKNRYEFDADSAQPDIISNDPGDALTVYFNLPNGLPESMFPLEFRIEAEKQGIENNKIGNLVVYTGPSLFDPKKIAISYLKTVSYAEYLYQYEDANTVVVDVDKPNTSHTVRARFTTISSVTAGDQGTIRVHNPYFNPDVEVTFTRGPVSN